LFVVDLCSNISRDFRVFCNDQKGVYSFCATSRISVKNFRESGLHRAEIAWNSALLGVSALFQQHTFDAQNEDTKLLEYINLAKQKWTDECLEKVIKSNSFQDMTSLMSVNQCCLETNGVEDSMAIWTLTLALIFSKLCMAMQDQMTLTRAAN